MLAGRSGVCAAMRPHRQVRTHLAQYWPSLREEGEEVVVEAVEIRVPAAALHGTLAEMEKAGTALRGPRVAILSGGVECEAVARTIAKLSKLRSLGW